MSSYVILKHLHMTAAGITVLLFCLRLLLDAAGRPGWRRTPLRWIPHVNDTVLLAAAIGLVLVTSWMPFVHGWLTAKIVLLLGYIVAGMFALRPDLPAPKRVVASVLALGQVSLIFVLAVTKPVFA